MAFNLKTGNIFNRHYAHKSSSQDTYVSGFYGLYIELPKIFEGGDLLDEGSVAKQYLLKEIQMIGGKKDIEALLAASVLSVDTVPEMTINVAQKTGMNGITAAVPTNIAVGNSLSVTFNEFLEAPITKIMRYWAHVIRGGVEGVSALKEGQYKEINYAATAYYWPLAPNALDIQMMFVVSGVFPDKDPSSLFTNNSADSANVTINMNFHCGRVRIADPKALETIKKKMSIINKDRQALVKASEIG